MGAGTRPSHEQQGDRGVGGLLQAAAAHRVMGAHRAGLAAQSQTLAVAVVAVAVYPLAFHTSMRLAGVAVGTVVSIGSEPMAAALIEGAVDRRPLSRRWALGATAGVVGVLALAIARAGKEATGGSGAQPVLGVALGLLASLTYALYSWGAARVMRRGLAAVPASTSTTLSLIEPAVAAIIAVLVLHEALPALC